MKNRRNELIKDLSNTQIAEISLKFSFDILSEWDFEKNSCLFPEVSILTVGVKSQKKLWWMCDKKHSYDTSVRHRSEGSLCPVCANRKLLTGFNDFATKHPELLGSWNKSKINPDPTTVLFSTSILKIEWPCENGHFYSTTPNQISRGRGCPYCNGLKILKGFNDLASKSPDSLKWWDYEKNDKTPEEVRYGSSVKVWWKCPLNHSYSAAINKFYNGRRCSICAGKTIHKTTQLSFSHSHLIKEWSFEKNNYSPDTISAGHDKRVWWKCQKCNHEWQAYVYNRTNRKRPQGCPDCAKGITSSLGEKQIAEFLLSSGIQEQDLITHKIIRNKKGKRSEIDIFIPSLNIGIEFNGIYYHSEKFVNKDYHYNKWKECKNQGIQLIQIWEDDWCNSQAIVKIMLLHKLGLNMQERINARETVVKEISYGEAQTFFNSNHIQKSVKASKYFGLVYKNEIVAAIALKQEDNKRTFNIRRYATSKNVVGGFTKLLSYIEKQYDFDKFITISDNCVSNGDLYRNNGFTLDKHLEPDYMYLGKNQYREHKFKYCKAKFKNDENLRWEENLTERQLAELNNLLRIYDAGKIKWVKFKEEPIYCK